ncbi:hypothetical protein, partial [Mesorhizobium sp. M0578]|uniref:hypothetical protein n=1 Tax=unclassified Mesorhizobium TaxID=325217 RepID=UPI00333B7801
NPQSIPAEQFQILARVIGLASDLSALPFSRCNKTRPIGALVRPHTKSRLSNSMAFCESVWFNICTQNIAEDSNNPDASAVR